MFDHKLLRHVIIIYNIIMVKLKSNHFVLMTDVRVHNMNLHQYSGDTCHMVSIYSIKSS